MANKPKDAKKIDIRQLFPPGEGLSETLGVNFPPSVANAIRRTGNRKDSISAQLLALIDPAKLAACLRADAEHMAKCDA